MSNYFRYLPFAGFFFVSAIARAILLSVLPLKALSLMETAQLVSVLFFAVSACGVAVSLSVPMILRKTGLHHCFLMSLFTTAVSVVLLGTEPLWCFAAGMVLHVFGVTSMEVVLSLYIM